MVIDAYTTWCGPCKMLDRQVFQDEEAGDYINRHFVAYKLDMEKGEGPYVAMKFRVQAYPTTLFLSPEGYLLSKDVGYPGKEGYLKWCQAVIDGEKQPYESINAHDLKPGFPEFYQHSFTSDQWKAKGAGPEAVNEYLKGQKDLSSEVNYSVIQALSYTGHDAMPWAIAHAEALKKKYPAEEVDDMVFRHISRSVGNVSGEGVNVVAMEKRIDQVLDSLKAPNREETREKLLVDLYYYQKAHAKLLDLVEKSEEFNTPGYCNTFAWDIYENSDDRALIKRSIALMQKAIQEDPNANYIDTLAHLYYKDGQKDQARKYAKETLAKAKEQGLEMKETQELLDELDG